MANWPLIALRIVGGIATTIIAIIGVIASLIPLLFMAGISLSSFDDFPDGFMRAVEQNLPTLIAGGVISILLMTLALTIAMAVWSFVEAGALGVWADGERASPPHAKIAAFNRFTFDAWLAHGKASWWAVFWIYNIVWGAAALALLIPLAAIAVPIVIWKENPFTWIGGCVSVVIVLIAFVLICLLADLWVKMSLAAAVVFRCGAISSLRRSIAVARSRFGEFLALVGTRIGLSMILNVPTAILYFVLQPITSSGDAWTLGLLPMQLSFGLIQGVVSIVAASWFLAGLVSLSIPLEDSQSHVDLTR